MRVGARVTGVVMDQGRVVRLGVRGAAVGALATFEGTTLRLEGVVSDRDGRKVFRDIETGKVSDEDYVVYGWRRLCRDDHLLRTASGVLATRTWPPLE